MTLTPEQRQHFQTEGFLSGLDVCDAKEAGRVRDAFDRLEQREGKEHCEIGLQGRHIDVEFIWQLAARRHILDCIEALMGPDILVLSTHFFCKYPAATSKFVAWHQDVTYWGLEPPFALTAWYAVDDSDVENGCMRVIPGSHQHGIVEHGKSSSPGNLLSINQSIETNVEQERAVDLVLKAGQMSIHHGLLVHGSNPNLSSRRRCGLTIRYCPPHVRPVQANSINKPWPAVLARGRDPFGHFGAWELQFA